MTSNHAMSRSFSYPRYFSVLFGYMYADSEAFNFKSVFIFKNYYRHAKKDFLLK